MIGGRQRRSKTHKFLLHSKFVTDVLDAKTGLKEMKIRSPDRLTLGHVNIKFD